MKRSKKMQGTMYLLLGILLTPPAMATESSSSSSVNSAQSVEEHSAIDLARSKVIHEKKLHANEIQLVSVKPHIWPNSGLGCSAPGSITAQVITPGYVIIFSDSNKRYIVHATDRYAVICKRNDVISNPHSVDASLGSLDAVTDKAKSDPAEKSNEH